ncbi:MAG: DUF2442 domain-containing protein [Cytophagales bacterium]|nr:MAG: DUF2442 domain-containing protein [Cytophagales bacterium]
MSNSRGYVQTKPVIDELLFDRDEYMGILFEDDRIVYVPLHQFPDIAHLTPEQRQDYHISGGDTLLFADSDTVYHVEMFLGTYQTNAHKPVR